MWFGDEALFRENVNMCARQLALSSRKGGSRFFYPGTATLELKKVKLMAKQITTLPKELVGVIRGLANPGLRVEGQQVQLHTQPCLEFEVRQERRGGKDHGV